MNWSNDDRQVIGQAAERSEETDADLSMGGSKIAQCWANLPMFDPRNKWRIRWDVFLMMFIVMNAILVPMDVALQLESTVGYVTANNVADTFFLIDILVSFRTGYIEKLYGNDLLHDKALDVGSKYLAGWFIIDVLSVGVPYNLLSGSGLEHVVTALGLLKLLRLARIPRLLKRVLNVPLAWKLIVRVVLLIIFYVFLCHLLGCFLLVLGESVATDVPPGQADTLCGDYNNQTCTWTVKNGLSKNGNDDATYATAFYFSVTTFISVGYGDISATNGIEKFAFTMVMLFTMMVTTVLFGSVVTIVDKLGNAKRRYDERKEAIEHFIECYHIEDEAATPMRDMVEFQWERTKFFDTDAVLELLPTPLRLEVLLDMNKTFMFNVPFFQDQDEAIIKEIVQVLGHELVLPGTMVIHEGQPDEKMYFNRYGKFEMLAPHSGVILHEISIGDYFGEIGLLVNHGRYSATVRACEHSRCEVATLSRHDLEKLMSTFPIFMQTFKKIGLERLRRTRSSIQKSKYSGQTEYRIVLEIVRGHRIMGDTQECVLMGEVICRSSPRRKMRPSSTTNEGGDNNNEKEEEQKQKAYQQPIQIGPIHRTERKRGSSPKFDNVFIINVCCHEMQRLENMEFVITMYQCHSWRPNSYIGTVIIYPNDVRLGVVQKKWYRLKNMQPQTECDIICKSIAEQDGVKRKKNVQGQLLLRLVRHRDSGGRDAQLRQSQGIRELTQAARLASRTFQGAKASAEMKRQEHVRNARSRNRPSSGDELGSDSGVSSQKKTWKSIKKNFLQKHEDRKKEIAEGFGAQSMMLNHFSDRLAKNRKDESSGSVDGRNRETTKQQGQSGTIITTEGIISNDKVTKLICSSKVDDASKSILASTERMLKLGQELMDRISP